MTPSALADLVDLVLAEAETLLAAAGRPAFGRVYRSHGQPAWDLCDTDTLTAYVAVVQPTPGTTGRGGCAVSWRSEVHVQIIRCVPTIDDAGRAPTAADLDASAADLAADVWVLAAGIGDLIVAAAGDCESATIGQARPLGPQGGLAAWDLPVMLSTPGVPVGS